MPLLFSSNILNYARNYRVCYIGGRYGGGKTALAFRLAYDLCLSFGFRYILSNVASVWCTPPDRVVLRDGVYADAVIILDEGGMYLDNAHDARQWLAYLRKLNVVLLVPSVLPPSRLMQRLTVQRTINADAFGLPLWLYGVRLDAGIVKVKDGFSWLFPSEIYGVYDTRGMPSDASELLVYLREWIAAASSVLGYRVSLPQLPSSAQAQSVAVPAADVYTSSETDALVNDLLQSMAESQLKKG
jgi:hypothetical protein